MIMNVRDEGSGSAGRLTVVARAAALLRSSSLVGVHSFGSVVDVKIVTDSVGSFG